MEIRRKPFQGVLNIIRFNRHFYISAFVILGLIFFVNQYFSGAYRISSIIIATILTLSILVSLIISYFIYDKSGFYKLDWLNLKDKTQILNINAGFDETSDILRNKLPHSTIVIADFYDSKKHTEISIKRARKIYPPNPKTIKIKTESLPFENETFDTILATLSAHEIRNHREREMFFKELNRILKNQGQILVTEHLRDLNNFLAYNIGFFHFHSKRTWYRTFKNSNFKVVEEKNKTPFIITFILKKNGITT